MGLYHSPSIVTNGLVLCLDAGNTKSYPVKNFVSSKIYSVFNGSLRSANYTVQYSDDNTNWTTAFSGVSSNNTSCGIQQNTGSGDGSYGFHRYWRYVEGSAIASHHPRVSRIILTDINGIDSNLVVYTSDNCSDSGTYIVGTVSLDFWGTTWTDLSGLGNTGTLTNGPTYSSANGGSIVFDGTNDYVQKSSATMNLSAGVTMEMIFRSTDMNSREQGFFQFNAAPNYINFYTGGDGKLRWETWVPVPTNGGAYTTPSPLSNNTWYHAVGTYTSGSSVLYINGSSVASASQSAGTYSSSYTANIIIGEYSGYTSGNIAIARIYNRALTAAEVSQNFNALRGRFGI